MAASLYEYNDAVSDTKHKYEQSRAAQEYGRFLGQQRFGRERETANQGFTQRFPAVTGRLAKRFGSRVRSGQTGAVLGNEVGMFQRQMGDIDRQAAEFGGQQDMASTQDAANYQLALLRLKERYEQGRALDSPYQPYTTTWGA